MKREITPDNLHQHAKRGWFWGAIEQVARQGLTMVVGLVLARLLEPAAFGLIASVSIFMTLSQQLIDGGIAQRVMQKKVLEEHDYNALFWCNAAVSLVSVAVLCALAAPTAHFYGEPRLVAIMAALAIIIFLMNAGRVQQTMLIRQFRFRTSSILEISSVVAGCIIGLVMAFRGYGVWALIGQQCVRALVKAMALWVLIPWRPSSKPAWAEVRDLYSFGVPIMASSTALTFALQLINVMIAKLYSPTQLGYFDRGRLIPQNLGFSLQNIFSQTNFPVLSRVQDNPDKFRESYLKFFAVSVGINLLLLSALTVGAKEIVLLLLGDKWLPAVWFFKISCVTFLFHSIYMVNLDALRAKGNVKLLFRNNMLSSFFQIVGVVAGAPFGVKAMVLGGVAGRFAGCWFVMAAVTSCGYVFFIDQLKILLRPVLTVIVLSIVLIGVRALPLSLFWINLLMGVCTLIVVFVYFKYVNLKEVQANRRGAE